MSVVIGESLVGSYLRYVRECHTVLYNVFTDDVQSEIDVIGIRGFGDQQEVFACEVSTHLDGILYGNGNVDNQVMLKNKADSAYRYVTAMFSGAKPHIEVWSPVVTVGQMSSWMERYGKDPTAEFNVDFVINEKYTGCIKELIQKARTDSDLKDGDAFRMLQILTHLKGEGPLQIPLKF